MEPFQGGEVVWAPSAADLQRSEMARFVRACGLDDYADLLSRADADPAWFWTAVVDFLDLRFVTPCTRVVDDAEGIEWTRYCTGARTNIVLNCLDRHRGTEVLSRTFVVHESESGKTERLSYAAVDAEVCRLAGGLRALGIGSGDTIGLYMPMIPETAIAFLAIVKIGAIVVPLFSGFGAEALVTRLNDAGARAIITVDATDRRGSVVELKSIVDSARVAVPTLQHVIVHRHLDAAVAWRAGDHWWHELVRGEPCTADTEMVDAEAPVMLVYTSGTTGLPKGTVHSHGGFMLKALFDLCVLCELGADDHMLWMSDMGWVVGPLQILGAAYRGATLALAEGAFNYPDPARLFRLMERFEVTWLGLAPTIARHYMLAGPTVPDAYDLGALRIVVSTGEPWTPDAWSWLFERVCAGRVPILNYTGGTEIGGGILGCTVLRPLAPCCFNTAVPGMGADVVDDAGRSLARGEVGELVLRNHSAGLTRGLWHDRERYLETYWRRMPGLWVHGDWAMRDAADRWYVLGRSDDTLKISGRRTGPAELESPLMATGRISDVAVIGLPDSAQGNAIVCVCVPLPGEDVVTLGEALSAAVVEAMGKAYRPRKVLFVPDLPRTRTLKVMRRVVKALLTGAAPGDLSSLVNPEALSAIASMRGAAGE